MLDSQSADTERHSEHHPAGPKEAAQAFLWAVWAEPAARTDTSFPHKPSTIMIQHQHHPLSKESTKPCSTSHNKAPQSNDKILKHTHTHSISLLTGKSDLECFLFKIETHFFIQINHLNELSIWISKGKR